MALSTQSNAQGALSEINVTPLVDVMLVLMVVFLVTAPLITQSVTVSLPKATAPSEANNGKDQPLRLEIDRYGAMSLNQQPVADLAALETTLKTELQNNAEVGLHLYADEAVSYAHVAKAMAAVRRAGIAKMGFVNTLDHRT